jgi:spermidine/putrescine-binding protein
VQVLRLILEYAAKEWAVISNAPVTSVLLFIFAFTLAYLAARWRYSGVIDGLKGQRELLTNQIADYKERLGLVPSDKTAYAKLTIRELKAEVAQYAAQLKEASSYLDNGEIFRIPAKHKELEKTLARTDSQEERDRLEQEFWAKAAYFNAVEIRMRTDLYESEYKPKVITLRNEMIRRLPEKATVPSDIYERLVSPTALDDIAEDLKRLAALLPERDSQ